MIEVHATEARLLVLVYSGPHMGLVDPAEHRQAAKTVRTPRERQLFRAACAMAWRRRNAR